MRYRWESPPFLVLLHKGKSKVIVQVCVSVRGGVYEGVVGILMILPSSAMTLNRTTLIGNGSKQVQSEQFSETARQVEGSEEMEKENGGEHSRMVNGSPLFLRMLVK